MPYARLLLCIAALLLGSRALAFTPESGTWWNPNESGSGFMLEIQDNLLFLTFYTYAADGRPLWFTSAGLMNGNARYVGELTSFRDGQCFGCPYRPPVAQVGAGGPVEIIFDTEIRGRISYAGRTIPIERMDYYLTRTTGDVRTDMMLGEWQLIADFAAQPGIGYPFYGDILVFDRVDRAPNPDIFDGCRASNSVVGRCTSSALANHDASGFYRASTGDHVIVVNDDASNFAYYVVSTGTYQFDGILKVCPKNLSNPTTQCLQSNTYRAYPVRGFRTASRSFVLTGSGPSEAPEAGKLQSTRPSLAQVLGGQEGGMDTAEVKTRFGIDLHSLDEDAVNQLVERMRSK